MNQEQIVMNLGELAMELNEQSSSLEKSLFPDPSTFWSVGPGSVSPNPNINAMLRSLNKSVEEIHGHPGFVWLERSPHFDETLQFFEKEINKVEDSEFNIARKRVRLLEAIAWSGWLLLNDSSWTPRKFSRAEKTHAVEIATELLAFAKNGLGRPDHRVMQSLEGPLVQFIDHMQADTKREYAGPADRHKEIAIRFVLSLRDFGLKQSKVVELLESTFSIFDSDLGHRTAQRHVQQGFAR